MKHIFLPTCLCAVLLLSVPAVAEEIVVTTGATFIEKVFNPVKPQLGALGLSFKIIYSAPTEALKNLEAGFAEVAGASLDADEWMTVAANRGYTVKDRSALRAHVVADEETVVIIHRSNNVPSLSKEQLQGIFSGTIQNWKEVGGPDLPVLVVWPRVDSGAITTFSKQVMSGSVITKEMLDVATINDTVDAVASNPEAISIANAEVVSAGIKKVATPALKRPLTLLTKGKPTPKVQKLLDFLQTAEARRAFR